MDLVGRRSKFDGPRKQVESEIPLHCRRRIVMSTQSRRSRREKVISSRARRTGLLLACFALALSGIAGVFGVHTSAQRADRSAQQASQTASLRSFDVRTEKDAAAAVYVARHAASGSFAGAAREERAAGAARLRAAFDVVDSPELGVPEVVSARPGFRFLSEPTDDRVGALRAFLSEYADGYGLSQENLASLELVADYQNPAGNMAWVEFEQKINGLSVFRGLVRGGFTAKGELAGVTGQLAAGLDAAALRAAPTLTAEQAVSAAAANVAWNVDPGTLVQKAIDGAGRVTFDRGSMAEDAKAWLLYFPLAPGVARLAWATEIWGNPEAFLILTDAEDGTVLFRKNLTNYQTQTATYVIYNDDSPAPLSPTTVLPGSGTQAPFVTRTSVTLIGNEPPTTFNSLGWMTDGTNVTDGNNVEAGVDLAAPDGVDAPVTGVNRVFNFPCNPQTDSPTTTGCRNAEVTDVFYWTNVYHDRLYLLGFTEAARNFQNNNFGRGGVAGDRISAEEQDYSGTNNANFSTPADGGRGRMQMYIFPGPTPARSSGFDHDVLLHELTHGTSNRLHNNGSGLNSTMSGGMGEGWSDFYARALLSSASENVNGIYAMGGWITYKLDPGFTDNYYYGVRRFPYAVWSNTGANGKPHNPLTFADIDQAQINLSNGAYPPAFVGSAFEVHNVGEVWCMALLEVRARFITRLGFAVGNQRVLQFITDGMKLDPVNPTLLQGRDSIIAAANAGGGTAADIADIWAGFAVRGMGFSARVVNAGTGAVVEAFDLPGLAVGSSSLVTESRINGWLDPGEEVTVSLCVKNGGSSASGSVVGTLLANGGVRAASGAQTFGPIAANGSVCRNFSFKVSAACGSAVTATLQTQESGGGTRNLAYSFPVGGLPTFYSQNFDGVIAPALPAGWTTSTLTGTANPWVTNATTPDSAPNRAFTADPGTVSDNVLVSPSITISPGARLTFRHSFDTEPSYDGGVLEIAIGAGGFQDIITAGGSFVSSGYTGTISTAYSSPIGGRQAWTGSSGGYITTAVTMPAAAAGQSVRLRWRMASDNSVAATGWSVDTIALSSLRCDPAPPGPNSNVSDDFDGDESNDLVVYRPSNGTWRILESSTGYSQSMNISWGVSTDVPVPGDYDGDGKADIAVYRPSAGYWFILQSSTNYTTYTVRQWGVSTDIPTPGDYDGDGKTDLAVYRPSTGYWWVLLSSTNNTTYLARQWGIGTDIPMAGDYDGDKKTDFAVYRPAAGYWYVLQSSTNYTTYIAKAWGIPTDTPVSGDYDGDGRTDLAVYRPVRNPQSPTDDTGYWYILLSSTSYTSYIAKQWGISTDIPVPGDYDGDGRSELAVYRPSIGMWYLLWSSCNLGCYDTYQWGTSVDIPVIADR
jgi:hypothetical protein